MPQYCHRFAVIRHAWIAYGCLTVLLCLFFAANCYGLDPSRSLFQLAHQSYATNSGHLLPPVRALAQTTDGYIWVGTDDGLFRFDGVRFVAWASETGPRLPSNEIRALAAGADGSLWIAAGNTVVRMRQGRMEEEGTLRAEKSRFSNLKVSKDGVVWATTNLGGKGELYFFRSGRWEKKVLPTGDMPTLGLVSATEGGMWAWPGRLLLVTPESVKEGCAATNVAGMSLDHRGILRFIENRTVGSCNVSGNPVAETPARLPSLSTRLFWDSEGSLWVGTADDGVYRMRMNGAMDHMGRREGMSADSVNVFFEDRERNIWIGTNGGLDRYSETVYARLTVLDGMEADQIYSVVAATGPRAWVATRKAIQLVDGSGPIQTIQNFPVANALVVSMDYRDGRLLVGSTKGLWRLDNGRLLRESTVPDEIVVQIQSRGDGGAWLLLREGIGELKAGRFRTLDVGAKPPARIPYVMRGAKDGGLWIGYSTGEVGYLTAAGSLRLLPRDVKAVAGVVYALVEEDGNKLWVGSGSGLACFCGGKWVKASLSGLQTTAIQDLVQDAAMNLWARHPQGVLRIDASDLDAVGEAPNRALRYESYGVEQGMRMQKIAPWTYPRSTQTRDGKVWFATDDGVAYLDPNRIRKPSQPPMVVIENVTADGKKYAPMLEPMVFPPLTREIRIEYTALSFTAPLRNQFRYKLDAFDSKWTEAGTRREAIFTNLGPKDYRFQVIAANADGVWNAGGSALQFTVQPAFYQSTWFYVVMVVLSSSLAYGLHVLRMRRLAMQQRIILDERTRIARELHDRLLQGIAGATWQLDALASGLPPDAEGSRVKLKAILDRMDVSMREARQSIASLRFSEAKRRDVGQALATMAADLIDGTAIEYRLSIQGTTFDLAPVVEDNVLAIAREAMLNVVRHAQATRIDLRLTYEEQALRIEVQDDGLGFDVAASAQLKDHFGLMGMRERAESVRAQLQIESSVGRGSKVVLVVDRFRALE